MRVNSLGSSQIFSTYFNNQNPAKQNMHTVSAAFQNKDVLTISNKGKNESLIQQLLNQKKLIEENKNALLKNGLENGYIDQEKLDNFDEQLKAIDEQIAKAYSNNTDYETEHKDTNKHLTKEEYNQQKLNDIVSISGSLKNSATALSVKEKLSGEKNILKSEIKSDGGNASESKFKRITEIDAKTSDIMEKASKLLSDIKNSASQTAEYASEQELQNGEYSKTSGKSDNKTAPENIIN